MFNVIALRGISEALLDVFARTSAEHANSPINSSWNNGKSVILRQSIHRDAVLVPEDYRGLTGKYRIANCDETLCRSSGQNIASHSRSSCFAQLSRGGKSGTICCTQSGSVQFEQGTGSSSFSPEEAELSTDDSQDQGVVLEANEAAEVPQPVNAVNRRISAWRWEVRRLKNQLQGYGAAGLLSYGFLNSIYYSAAFLVFWNLAKVPRGLGWAAVVKQFAAVMGATWVASQVSKIPRAAFALVLAPTVDGVLIYLQTRLRLRSRRNATALFVGSCLLVAAVTFGLTLLLWA